MPDDDNGVIDVKDFIRQTLQITSYFLLGAIPIWMLISIYTTKEHIIYTLVCFFGSFVVLTLIHMSHKLKYQKPLNWICIILCYGLMTVGLGTFIMNTKLITTMIVVAVTFMIWAAVLFICWFLINNWNYPHPFKLAAIAILGFIVVIVIFALDTIQSWKHTMDAALAVLLCSVVILMISHVLITYDGSDIVIKDDTLLIAFVLYMDYVLILVAIFISMIRIRNFHHLDERD
ncbi:uncharacterized protein LOC115626500 [Scaptodrosophila lebanonensis]|uniref:Uncharacterized protein LOC115626500 n=1 Tax=Drosophila lebanonensis TaxID=7225 RepID=A0A6J2TMF0_DROLE|nr:uncharacterized protein LOC115626500 [Scaptodrosophila lebanonensis]